MNIIYMCVCVPSSLDCDRRRAFGLEYKTSMTTC